MRNVLIVAEQRGGILRKGCLPAFSFGKAMAEKIGGEFHILVAGYKVASVVQEVQYFGADKIWVFDSPSLENYLAENYIEIIAEVVRECDAEVVATVSSTFGKDLMPGVAAMLKAGMIPDLISLVEEGGRLLYKRPLYAGNLIATYSIETEKKVFTIRGTEFPPPAISHSPSPVQNLEFSPARKAKADFVSLEEIKSERPELTEAKTIVSGGRGAKGKEGFEIIEKLADLLGAAIGATRAAVDAGWVPNDLQVGQTGKIVAPDLYFAIGISGALQHIAGMKGSKVIVAINKDEEAPIFSVADYGIVGDMFKIVPELIEEIKKAKAE